MIGLIGTFGSHRVAAQTDSAQRFRSGDPEIKIGDDVSVMVVRENIPEQTGRIEFMDPSEIRLRQTINVVGEQKDGTKVRHISQYLIVIPRSHIVLIRKQLSSTTQPIVRRSQQD